MLNIRSWARVTKIRHDENLTDNDAKISRLYAKLSRRCSYRFCPVAIFQKVMADNCEAAWTIYTCTYNYTAESGIIAYF